MKGHQFPVSYPDTVLVIIWILLLSAAMALVNRYPDKYFCLFSMKNIYTTTSL